MNQQRIQHVRKLLWLYFWLVIFEGALRKWFLPGLSNALLIIRDPVALLALWRGLPLLVQPQFRPWLEALTAISFTAFLLAMLAGHGDLFIALYGVRIFLLHFALIFLFPAVFDQGDVLKFAKAILFISIPMTALIVLQSNSPSAHFLNVAPGGEGTTAFQGALDRFRPSGTFSFINALALFYTLVASSVCVYQFGLRKHRLSDRILASASSIALIVAIPVSISRSLLVGSAVVFAALLLSLLLSRTRVSNLLVGLVSLLLFLFIASHVPAFRETRIAFVARWEGATITEGGDQGFVGVLDKRVLGVATESLRNTDDYPILGHGIGLGTNVGAKRQTGDLGFALSENPWAALIGELGLPLGFAFISWRVCLGLSLLRRSIASAVLGNIFPLAMLGTSLPLILIGLTAQPSALGFLVLSTGLTWASSIPPQAHKQPSCSIPGLISSHASHPALPLV